ncbi:hypothetical protein, partial [Sphingopyxis solisilvae]|uniref:hypothetical protein n=1 Tax=Sphingopyxis solisilvae TaxID=1886788 RepID=UPI001E2D24F2
FLTGRLPGEPPPTLFEYLPDNALPTEAGGSCFGAAEKAVNDAPPSCTWPKACDIWSDDDAPRLDPAPDPVDGRQ